MDSERLREKILTSVNALKEPYKSIVVLRELQDLSYEEISEALELPLTTVKVYLHRGRRTLRKALHELYNEFIKDEFVSSEFLSLEGSPQPRQTNNQTAV